MVDFSDKAPKWSQREFLGVAAWQFIVAFVLLLLGLVLKKISDFIFEKKIIPRLAKTKLSVDHLVAGAISKPLGNLIFIVFASGALAVLPLPSKPDVSGFAFSLIKILLGADVVWFLFRCVDVLSIYLTKLSERTESALDDQLVPLVRKALKVTILLVCVVWIIQLLGYSVSSLIAGLGIGGLAVALALQDPLTNFFGSIVIFLDRPFVVGDWVVIGDVEGIVEDVGFRTTRIRTWPKTVVSIPNKKVAEADVDNKTRMPIRLVLQEVGVTYETTADQMEAAVASITELLHNDKDIDKENIVVRFTEFADSSLNILVRYFTLPVDFVNHLQVKERINLSIMRILADMGLSIAFPTRSIYLEGGVTEALKDGLQKMPSDE